MSIATYNAKQLGEVLGVSESMGYKLIRQMNAELTQKGFLVIRGRVSQAYVAQRFFGGNAEPTDGNRMCDIGG